MTFLGGQFGAYLEGSSAGVIIPSPPRSSGGGPDRAPGRSQVRPSGNVIGSLGGSGNDLL